MGSGVIYYEYEKREKFEDHGMRADAELGSFKIRRYHFDNDASKSEKSSAERQSSSRRPSPHYSPRTMLVAQRERSTSSVKGTRSFRRSTASSSVRKSRS
ncbi:hypothetical protein PIB30_054666 [Stylosanthes scabra]|uniref:Uncharacterized protein n=1 Tax=Stylosanthes scabra TaxID=79078 RepID=A0ABU6RJ70_9FABA|nr:hypothetical protein [Stylosanthes scabra]